MYKIKKGHTKVLGNVRGKEQLLGAVITARRGAALGPNSWRGLNASITHRNISNLLGYHQT